MTALGRLLLRCRPSMRASPTSTTQKGRAHDCPADENGGYYYALADGTKISEEEYIPRQNEGADLYNELLDTDASPRAKQTIWLIGDEMPETMSYFGLDDGRGRSSCRQLHGVTVPPGARATWPSLSGPTQ